MAPLTTHLVIGERVFAQLSQLDPVDYGGFLLGNVLVDVHVFGDVERRTTHFAERLAGDGPLAFHRSCANFLSQLDGLLARPWDALTSAERAFVAGYLCHLAADEDWKQFDWDTLHTQGIYLWTDLPVPGDVILTAFDVLSSELYVDFPSVASALRDVAVPDLWTHVPYGIFQAMWETFQAHFLDHSTLESYFETERRLGKTGAEVEELRHQHEVYWEDAVQLIQTTFGGIQSRVQAMVQHSLKTMPRLWR